MSCSSCTGRRRLGGADEHRRRELGRRRPVRRRHARGCYATLQSAFDAAHDGDRIRINPGTYAGGVTVRVSVHIKGAGAASTIISGGGPVLTVGEANAASEPTVTISGVTITGGLSRAERLVRPKVQCALVRAGHGARRWYRDSALCRQRCRGDRHDHRQRDPREPGRTNDDRCEREGDLQRCSLPLRVRRRRRDRQLGRADPEANACHGQRGQRRRSATRKGPAS